MTRRYLMALVDGGGNIPPEHGTVMKALAAGVPMVVMPHGRDQGDTAARVTARGAGITLKRSATPHAIADAVRNVLEGDAYRIAARELGAVVRRDASTDALIHELEAIPRLRIWTNMRG